MAKVKTPRKSSGVKATSPSTPPVSSDTSIASAVTAAAHSPIEPPAIEPAAIETGTIKPERTEAIKPQPASVSARPGPSQPEAAKPEVTALGATKAETRRAPGRPEIVKTESRANLVPINVEEEIRRLAYIFSERRGFVAGHETEDWLNAEREIRERYHQQSA